MKAKVHPFIPCRIECRTFQPSPPPPQTIVSVTFPVPIQDLAEARAFAAGTGWQSRPELSSILALTKSLEECANQAFNRRINSLPSPKAILAGIRKRLDSGPVENVTIEVFDEFWYLVEGNARHYGISPAEHCLRCIGYHAALWREREKTKRPLTSLESFERKLGKESRASRKTMTR